MTDQGEVAIALLVFAAGTVVMWTVVRVAAGEGNRGRVSEVRRLSMERPQTFESLPAALAFAWENNQHCGELICAIFASRDRSLWVPWWVDASGLDWRQIELTLPEDRRRLESVACLLEIDPRTLLLQHRDWPDLHVRRSDGFVEWCSEPSRLPEIAALYGLRRVPLFSHCDYYLGG